MLWFCFIFFAFAEEVIWDFQANTSQIIEMHIDNKRGKPIFIFRSQDGEKNSRFGWMADQDPQKGKIRIHLEALWLQPGEYHFQRKSPNQESKAIWTPNLVAPRHLMIQLPEADTAVLGVRYSQNELKGLAYAADQGGNVAFLPLDNKEGWEVQILYGLKRYQGQQVKSGDQVIRFHPANPFVTRLQSNHKSTIRWILAPTTLLLCLLLPFCRKRWPYGWCFALFLSLLLSSSLIWNIFPQLDAQLLMGELGFDDPPTSASLLAAIADSLRNLSDHSTTFSFPEGHSWLILGPSWLSYLIFSPLVWLKNAIFAHNIGMITLAALLCWTTWGYARALGAGKYTAFVAGAGAIFAPALLNEFDKMSLDRAFLFPLPLFLLCLTRYAEKQSWRWFLSGAVAFAGLFYGQFYYGIYLGAALPLLLLPRVIGKNWFHKSKKIIAMTLLGLLLISPGLYLLQESTTDTIYQSKGHLIDEVDSIWKPVSTQEAKDYLQRYDPRSGEGVGNKPMNNAKERLLAAVCNSIRPTDIGSPSVYFIGLGWFWILILGAWIISSQKKEIAITAWDVGILSLFALGPLWRSSNVELGVPLPYYIPHLLVPSFDQLKHPDRYALMAASIAGIPLALGAHALLRYIKNHYLRITLLCALIFVALTFGPLKDAEQSFAATHIRNWEGKGFRIGFRKPLWPTKIDFPSWSAIEKIEGQNAIFYPIHNRTPTALYLPALRHHISLQNHPPHGFYPHHQLPAWTEENALLNHLAFLTASKRPRRFLGWHATLQDRKDLLQHGLDHIVILKNLLLSQEHGQAADRFLRQYATAIHQDEYLSIWKLHSL